MIYDGVSQDSVGSLLCLIRLWENKTNSPLRGEKPQKCSPGHFNLWPQSVIPITLPLYTKNRGHPKPLSNILSADACAWTQLDGYLLLDHIRRCFWLFTTMTFSVSLCCPSRQASETWALCYNAPLCPLTYGILAQMWPWKILRMSSCSKKHLNLPKCPLGLMARARL